MSIAIIGSLIGGIVLLFMFIVLSSYVLLWFQALVSGAPVGFVNIVLMRFRKVNPSVIVQSRIAAKKAGLEMDPSQLEAHFMAGGNVIRVIQSLIAADKADIPLNFQKACSIDLAGRDVLDAVRTSVNPKVIDVPNPNLGKQTIDAVAKDGIQLLVRARVTVRSKIERIIGGATEETIIARVGEGIVTTIGSAKNHKEVLENPDMISRVVLEKGLDSGTAYEILSIDIADIDIGKNIGAELQATQAEADKKVAQAKAEERRAFAISREQEMKAQVVENQARVVLAEAEIPKAIAQALREGNLGVMDLYRLKNIDSDTQMRKAIAGDDDGEIGPLSN
ncbi:MAG: flotillin-like protein FloA [Planctomycetota bacterium]|nr:flotillin-like protein FloA [Planctomycetota bacterium]MDA1140909.1 flotillin-like protein FloA [Planctomycetota bacterium]